MNSQKMKVWGIFGVQPRVRTGEGAEKLTIEQRQRLAKGLFGVMKRFQYEGPELD